MNEIKNLHFLTGIASESNIKLMELAAKEHRKYSNITFKILDVKDSEVIIQVDQGKSAAGNYQTQKRLIEIVQETYGRFFPGMKIHVRANIYKQPDCNQVTPDWIAKQMSKAKIKLKTIADETGLDYGNLSELSSGKAPISKAMKALFWYYFKCKLLEKDVDNGLNDAVKYSMGPAK